MKRRGFFKYLAAAPIALAVKPPKKKVQEVITSQKISDEKIMKAYEDILDKMQIQVVSEIHADLDRGWGLEVVYKAAA